MNALDLARLSHTLVHQAGCLALHRSLPSRAALSVHLDASRQRMDYWSGRFQTIGRAPAWRLSPAVVRELQVSEILVRINAAIARIGLPASSPMFEHLQSGHALLRHQVEQLLIGNRLWLKKFAVVAERCRRWTDLLLGQLLPLEDVRDLGFDRDRVEDYASHAALGPLAISLTRDSMLHGLQGDTGQETGCESLNHQIACSTVSCLPARVVVTDEELESLWRHPLQIRMTAADNSPRWDHRQN